MKLTISSENKFYDRNESSPTKYCHIRISQQFFKKFLCSPLKEHVDIFSNGLIECFVYIQNMIG